MNSSTDAAPSPGAYFVLTAYSPDDPAQGDGVNGRGRGEVERFLADWTRRCLPLPVCSTTSERAFQAYRYWCRLQRIDKPAGMNRFVCAARAAGFINGRHVVRQHAASEVGQHVVLHPPKATPLKAGRQLDLAASAFALALVRWRQAAGDQLAAAPAVRP